MELIVDVFVHWSGSLVPWFIVSLVPRFLGSLIPWFLDSLILWFLDLLNSWVLDSLIPWFLASWFLEGLCDRRAADIIERSVILCFCTDFWRAFAIAGPLVSLPGHACCVSPRPHSLTHSENTVSLKTLLGNNTYNKATTEHINKQTNNQLSKHAS